MSTQTSQLLQECNSGCKMAVYSMNQVIEFVKEDALEKMIEKYKYSHELLEEETSKLLKEHGKEEKEPGIMATAFSWLSTETKLVMKNSDNQIAKVLMDGCEMGIQSITEDMHKCSEASKDAKKIAEKLIKLEEEMRKELKEFL